MNGWIQEIFSQGRELELYGTICTIGTCLALAYGVYHGIKVGLRWWQSLIVIAATYLFMSNFQSFIYRFLVMIEEKHIFGLHTSVNSIVRVFIFLPLVGWLLSKILRLKWSLVCDATTAYPLLLSGINQLACLSPGCCRGYRCSWGVYNVKIQDYCFPTQILETVLTLGIFAFFVAKTHRKGFVSDGKLLPMMIALYGAQRFICEMLRDNEKLIFGISPVGVHAMMLCLLGVYVLMRSRIKDKEKTKV